MARRVVLAAVAVLAALPGAIPAGAAELVMFRSDTCEWCALWEAEVGIVYDRTEEARVAPLRRVDIEDPLPADLGALARVRFTPTFVLVDRGREVGRIVGYPGEDFFWGLLGELIERLDAPS